MKYTAKEILTLAGVKPEEKLGKVGCSIAGVTVNTPEHVINMQSEKKATVIVGDKSYDVDLPEQDAPSEDVQKALEAKGREATKKAEALRKAKTPKAETPKAE